MNKKLKLISSAILMVLMSVLAYAIITSEYISPADNYYMIDGGTSPDNVTFSVNATTNASIKIVNMTLWTNISGTWAANYTNDTDGTIGSKTNRLFIPLDTKITAPDLADGLVFVYNFYTCTNSSGECLWISNNRTVFVEDSPLVELVYPTTDSILSSSTIVFNYSVTGDSDTYTCHLYSNDTGTWHEEGTNSNVANATNKTHSTVITSGTGIVWNVKCSETTNSNIIGWSSANYTITVDTTAPTVVASAESYSNDKASDGYSARISVNATDSNADSCKLYINDSINNTVAYTSGTQFYQYFNATDGGYEWYVACNNTAGGSTSSTATAIVIDTVMPSLSSYINGTDIVSCIAMPLNFTLSEVANFTLEYGLTADSRTTAVRETDYSLVQSVDLTFNDAYETTHYSNFTFCDRAGNCNTTENAEITTPIPLCTGWSLWSVYDSAINLSDYRTNSGADYIYNWNNTDQSWIYSSDAGSLNEDYEMGVGDVVYAYESTGTTYFRNTSVTASYNINITAGHAYFGLYHDYSFGNITHGIFLNSSGGNSTPTLGNLVGGLEFQVDYFAGYNNSGQTFVNSIYTWSWQNDTTLGNNYKNGIDTLWAYVPYNLSINFTPSGEVIGNWT